MKLSSAIAVTPAGRVFAAVALAVVVATSTAVVAPRASAETLAARRAEAAKVAADVAVLDARLDVAVSRYAAAAQELAALEERIADNEREIDEVGVQLAIAEQQLGMRAEALYKQGGSSLLDVLLATSSFDELLSRAEYIRRVGRSDAAIVDSVSKQRDHARAVRRQLQRDLTRAERVTAARAERRAVIEAALGERQTMLAGIRAAVERLTTAAAAKAGATDIGTEGSGVLAPDGESQGEWGPLIRDVAAENGISAQGLYRLMMIESGGVATAANGPYRGLYQYSGATWRGSWNPWRSRDIFDGAAQIRATGLAIRLGHGPGWWPSTYGWAFSS